MTGEAIATGRKGFNWRRFLDKHRDVVVIYGILIADRSSGLDLPA